MKNKGIIFLLVGLLMSCASPTPPQVDEQWLDATATEQLSAMEQGLLTSETLLKGYLERIERLDKQGPTINSVLSLNPNALSEAQALDAMRANGEIKGPLHGLVVLLKDNIESKELPTTAGSLAFINNHTYRDSPLAANLRNAGAIILGKTNLSEWANFRSEDSSSGWSAVGGLTRNPHMLNRSACGSSSGSGAAIAAGLASLAVGTETNGSIICPSSMNGIVGFKPTVGLVSRRHIVPISHTQDTAGPMVKSVEDAALMVSVMASTDAQDDATLSDARPEASELANSTINLAGLRIGVVRWRQGEDKDILALFDTKLDALRAAGAELVEISEHSQPDDFWKQSYFVLLAEFKTSLNQYILSSPASLPVSNLSELIGFNEASKREMALFDQSIFILSEETQGTDDARYATALNTVRAATRSNGIDKMLAQHNVNILIAPSNNPAFMIDAVYGDHSPKGFIGIGYMAAIAGYPHLTVPMGAVRDLPVGLSVIGGQWDDAKVLGVGKAIQAIAPYRLKPGFYPSRYDAPSLSGVASPY